MKRSITIILMFLTTTPALANYTCRTIGNTTYCNDYSGNYVTCRVVGNTTYCS